MITLDVEKYCQNCNRFQPCIVKKTYTTPNEFNIKLLESGSRTITDTIVYCTNRDDCDYMFEYIKREVM